MYDANITAALQVRLQCTGDTQHPFGKNGGIRVVDSFLPRERSTSRLPHAHGEPPMTWKTR